VNEGASGRRHRERRGSAGPLSGLLDSLRSLLHTVLSLAHDRAELAAVELEEEASRLVRMLLWGLAAALCAIVGAALLGTMVLLAVAPERRVLASGVLGFLFLAFAGFGYLRIRRVLAEKARPFAASLQELEKDLEHLRDLP